MFSLFPLYCIATVLSVSYVALATAIAAALKQLRPMRLIQTLRLTQMQAFHVS